MPIISVVCYYIYNAKDYNDVKLKYIWICPNPDCYHWNDFDNNIIIQTTYCGKCNCNFNIDKTVKELSTTFVSKDYDEYIWCEVADDLHSKYSNKAEMVEYYDFTIDNIYKDSVSIVKLINDSQEEIIQHNKKIDEYFRIKNIENENEQKLKLENKNIIKKKLVKLRQPITNDI